jgi:two-component system response regulator RegX3
VADDTAQILVVDDEDSILEFVSFNLEKEGYAVACAKNGDEALEAASEREFDLVVLDIMLPGTDGFEVCRKIRATSDVPVLFLSARDTELDKVVGLEIGGDDYLAKPFGIRELQARVKALLRRSGGSKTGGDAPGERLAVGDFVLDEASHTAEYQGRIMDLTPREFELLACLMRHEGQVLSREQLLRQAWDWEYVVETKTVDTHVKRLRDKLEAVDASPELIETVRGYGYRLKP